MGRLRGKRHCIRPDWAILVEDSKQKCWKKKVLKEIEKDEEDKAS